eukprot:TRINITY_DN12828_c0_g1_i2.p1 TRINITY_DN12828_c0_g1~~TRINITY_DN12828_c0_g1_i2.p1  ORF type:complete len:233 (+),score=7.09 TRINITY_DN12828_c0_g1_i2:37-699(+)
MQEIHLFGHIKGVDHLYNLLIHFPNCVPICHYERHHDMRMQLEAYVPFTTCFLIVVKQPSISPVLFGVDGDFPEIKNLDKLSNLHIVFVPGSENAQDFFCQDWINQIVQAQPTLWHFKDRLHYVNSLEPIAGLHTLENILRQPWVATPTAPPKGDSSVEESLSQEKTKQLLNETSSALKDIVHEFNSFFRDSFADTVQAMKSLFDKEQSTTPQVSHLRKK